MKFSRHSKWIKYFLLGVALISVYYVLQNASGILAQIKYFFSVLSPFIGGFAIAYVLYFPVSKLEKLYKNTKWSFIQKSARPLSVFTVYIIIGFLLVGALTALIPKISGAITDMIDQFPSYINLAVDYIHRINEDINIPFSVDLEALIQSFSISELLKNLDISSSIGGIVSVSSSVLKLALSIISSIYFLLGRKSLKYIGTKALSLVVKEQQLSYILKYLNKTHEFFSKFISCQIIDSMIIGTIATVGLSIIGVKYSMVLGPLIGVSNMIPYFGSIISSLCTVVITIFTGGIGLAVTAAVFLLISQQLDGNVIQPKILGTSMKLEPLLVIIAITVGGAYLGAVGMIIAIPVIALLRSIIGDIFIYREEKKALEKNASEANARA